VKISEIFYSLQGEGARAGEPSIFVRLAGCDLTCNFCDTEFESGEEMSNEQLLEAINGIRGKCFWIVWTGGEPALQLTKEIVEYFSDKGFNQAIETNGGHKVPDNLDFVTVSPKVAEHVLKSNFPNGVTELKYVRHAGHRAVPQPSIRAKHYFISPAFDGDKPNRENIKHCINLIKENPTWKLSLQMHKLLKIL